MPLLLLLAACAPPAPTVVIDPATPTTDDDLTVTVDGIAEGDAWSLTWSRDGEPTDWGATVPASETLKGDTWQARVVVTRGEREGPAGLAAVTIADTPPGLTLTLPATAPSGDDLTALADARDADGEAVALTWSWTRDGAPTDLDGPTVPADRTTRGEVWTVTAVPRAGGVDGAAASTSVTIANGLPTVTVEVTPAPPVAGRLVATVTAADPDGDAFTTAFAWRVDGTPAGEAATLDGVSRGQQIDLTVTVDDGDRATAVSWGPTPVANSAPTWAAAAILPAAADRTTPLRCVGEGWSDADGDPPGQRVQWTADGALVSDQPEWLPDVPKGSAIGCALTPWDGLDGGPPVTAAPITLGDAAPRVEGARILPDPPRVGEPLFIEALLSDPDGDELTRAVRWTVDGADVGAGLVLLAPPRGRVVSATLTVDDGERATGPIEVPAVTVANTPPQITSAQILGPVTRLAPAVAVAEVNDPDGDAVLDLRWTWTVDGVPVEATGDTLDPTWFRAGQTLEATAIASDDADAGAPVSTAPQVVATAPPTADRVRIDPTPVREDSVVRCLVEGARDPDGDVITQVVSWELDDAPFPGAETLDGRQFDRGQRIRCAVTLDDGEESALVWSAPVIVENTPPRLAGLTIGPEPLTAAAPAEARPLGFVDPDPADRGRHTLAYAWSVGGRELGTDATLPADRLRRGDRLTLVAVPIDPLQSGQAAVAQATVTNAAPSIVRVAIEPAEAWADTPLTAVADARDADGDPVSVRWAWSVAPDVTAATLAPGPYARGDDVVVTATPDDGQIAGPTVASAAVRIRNKAPEPPEVAITPAFPVPGDDDLRCAVAAPSFDLDGDAVTYAIAWRVDGQPYPRPGDAGPRSTDRPFDTVPAADVDAGAVWTCSITPFDVEDVGIPGTAQVIPVSPALRSLSMSYGYGCGVESTGRVRCWGANDQGQATPPPVVARAVSTGPIEACAIDDRGALRCWGSALPLAVPPAGAFSALDVGVSHACALRTTGALACWGDDADGKATPPGGAWRMVSVGLGHSCAVDAAGTMACWGDDADGQATAPDGTWREVAAGDAFTCGLTADGEVRCWGALDAEAPAGPFTHVSAGPGHACGVRADGTAACWGAPVADLTPPAEVRLVSALPGGLHACGVTTDGAVRCWGDDPFGAAVPPVTPWEVISAGDAHTCGLLAGRVSCWGNDTWGQSAVPAELIAGDVHAGTTSTCALDLAGLPRCWGDHGLLAAPATPLRALSVGDQTACGVTLDGALTCWGDDTWRLATPPPGSGWAAVAVSEHHACALDEAGTVACWGASFLGETAVPDDVWRAIDVGAFHTCGVNAAGAVRCWGDDAVGQSTVPAGTAAVDVALGARVSCARAADGALTCWGDPAYGQDLPPPGAWSDVRMGADHGCGVVDGEPRCWGLFAY